METAALAGVPSYAHAKDLAKFPTMRAIYLPWPACVGRIRSGPGEQDGSGTLGA
jgi:hypothetical protein